MPDFRVFSAVYPLSDAHRKCGKCLNSLQTFGYFGLAKELQHAEQCVKWDVRNVIVPKSVVPLPDLLHLNLCFVVVVVVVVMFFDLYTHFSFKISLICYGAADNWSHQKAEKCIECTVVNMYKWIGNDDRTELWRKNQSDAATKLCAYTHITTSGYKKAQR